MGQPLGEDLAQLGLGRRTNPVAPAAPRVKGQDERKTALDARRARCVWLTIANAGGPGIGAAG